MERYRSGHNGTDSKSVDGQPSVGSNPTCSAIFRDVAQFGRALRSGRRGRRFKSCHPDHFKSTTVFPLCFCKHFNISGCSAGGSALDWGSRGRRFKSCHSDHTKSISIHMDIDTFFTQNHTQQIFRDFSAKCYP